jgi:hypothetical protein
VSWPRPGRRSTRGWPCEEASRSEGRRKFGREALAKCGIKDKCKASL